MATKNQFVPNHLSWPASKYHKKVCNQNEEEIAPNYHMNTYEHKHVPFPSRHKDPKVLKKNGQLQNEDDNPVQDFGNVDIL